ncbi:MAG: response regulator transcription factor [Chloroflexi bacterium]|nr:response regulator transcription factor [Chloroflexota bacterium]
MEPIRVLIVDDHQIVREGLRAMMAEAEGISVVGEAGDGEEAIAMAQELAPSLVLMDIRMPKMDGLEVTRRLKSLFPTISVVIISVYDDEAYIVDAIRAGAAGYILKDVSKDLLVHTLKAVSAGGVLLKSTLLRRALESMPRSPREDLREDSTLITEAITPREHDVLRLMVEGLTNRQIAAHLSLAEDTVKKHVQSLIAKLQSSDRTQAAVKAVRAGLVPETGKN